MQRSKRVMVDISKGHKPGPMLDGMLTLPNKEEQKRILERTGYYSGSKIRENSLIFNQTGEDFIKQQLERDERIGNRDLELMKKLAEGLFGGKYNYRKTVAGVIYQGKDFLLVQKPHWDGWWDFVQEGVKKGKSLEDTLSRGLYEELKTRKFGNPIKTNIHSQRLFSEETLKHYPDRGYDGKSIYYLIVEYLGKKDEIILGDDLASSMWCDKNLLLKLIYKPEIKVAKKLIKFMEDNSYLRI